MIPNRSSDSPLDCSALEERILYSASPLASLLGEPIDIDCDDCDLDNFDASMFLTEVEVEDLHTELPLEKSEIVFVDGNVENYELFVDDINSSDAAHIEIVFIDSDVDGIEAITRVLSNRTGISAIHIVSHGEDGIVQLGNTQLSATTLEGHAGDLAAWGGALAVDADLLFYGCDVAASEDGQHLIDSLSELTGADVAASSDLTGHASLGGDWDFEYEVGLIETAIAFSANVEANWHEALQLLPTGGETLVNGNTTGNQDTTPNGGGNVAMDGNGNYAITWEDYRGGANADTYLQIYNADGSVRVSEFRVHAFDANHQDWSNVAMTDDGNVVVTWSDDRSGNYETYMRLFDIDGAAITGETLVSTLAGTQDAHSVDTAADGSFVVVFQDASATNIYFQRYNSSGVAQGGNTIVNTTTANTQNHPHVAVADDGSFVVTWEDSAADASGQSVRAQRFDATGVAQGSEFQVNTTTLNDQSKATVDSDGDGNFVVTWMSAVQDGDSFGIFAQRYAADGSALGGEFQVNTYTTLDQGSPNVAVNENGDFIITWHSNGQDVSNFGVYAQQYDSGGTAIGGEFKVSTSSTNAQEMPTVAYTGEQAVVVWSGDGNQSGQVDSSGVFLQRLSAAYTHSLVVDTNSDVVDGTTTSIDALLANSGGSISLREAIQAANNTLGADTISFSIGTGAQTISVGAGGLELITDEIILDATTQSGYVSTPLITLDGIGATGATGGLVLRTSNSTISGFNIINFPDEGIEIDGSTGFGDNNIIENNWIGITSGGAAAGVGDDGILITEDADGNVIRDNIVGSNGVVSGTGDGIHIRNDSDNNWVWGNTVGLGSDGSTIMANAGHGVHISGTTTGNIVGGDGLGGNDDTERNIVSGNAVEGVHVGSGSTNTRIANNYIGLDSTGLLDRGNTANGVYVFQSDSTYVLSNVVSGNDGNGIVFDQTDNSFIQGNIVGLNKDGDAAVGNTGRGIILQTDASGNLIGGSTATERNVISGNNTFSTDYAITGVFLTGVGTDNNRIQGNYIGLNAAGDAVIANESHGVQIDNGASNNFIGSDDDGNNDATEGNYIVGSDVANGIVVSDWTSQGTTGNTIYGNYIGTDATGTANWGNSYVGVHLTTAQATTVGGIGAFQANVIANNWIGVLVESTSSQNRIRGNSIHSNGLIGIDLGNDGVTPNDTGAPNDADTGANNLQNWAALNSVAANGSYELDYDIDTTTLASGTYTIDFYASTDLDGGVVEGNRYLGSLTGIADGIASIAGTLAGSTVAAEEYITLVTTDASGNSSEFSAYAAIPSATLIVDTTNDTADGTTTDVATLLSNKGADGFISLREAILAVNNDSATNWTIDVGAGTYSFLAGSGDTTGDFDIRNSMTIVGAGIGNTIIDANQNDRVFEVFSGTVTFQGMTIQDGYGNAVGSAIDVNTGSDVTLDTVRLFNNHTTTAHGGAILNSGTLTIRDSVFDTNSSATGDGGAIRSSGVMTIERTTFENNSASSGLGGAILQTGTGSGSITDSLFVGNSSTNASGGAIYLAGDLTITNTTFSGNTTNGLLDGSAIFVTNGTTTLQNVTVTGNIHGDQGAVRVTSTGTLNIGNTIIAGNTGGASNDLDNAGTLNDLGNNLIGDGTGQSDLVDGVNGNQVGTSGSPLDPLLGALADNGGPTQTHALLAGSSAIDAGTNTGAPATDQRGASRDASTDIGSYEFGAFAPGQPTDLLTTRTNQGGLSINQDGGNDIYLQADDGGALLGTLTSLTYETRFSTTDSSSQSFVSYATASNDNEFKLVTQSDGDLVIQVGSQGITISDYDFRTLNDGAEHTVSFTWQSSLGVWYLYIDGVEEGSGIGLASGQTIDSGGVLVIGNEQDSLGGSFDPNPYHSATIYDARLFGDVRTASEIATSYRSTLSHDEVGMLANWRFDDLSSDGVVTDSVSGNNLTVNHISGAGFTASEASLTFSLNENALDGTIVGQVSGVDVERDAEIASLLAADSDLRYSAVTGKFYKVITGSFDWDVAKTNAEASALNTVNGQLATIRSAAENEFIRDLANTFTGGGSVYLGGTDATVEGEWRWIEDGNEADEFWDGAVDGYRTGQYSNWFSSTQPNDFGGNEDAIRLDSTDGTWYDAPTTGSANNYIIEWNADAVLDTTQALTYAINSQTVAGAFAIDASTGQITVADGTLLDYETNVTHTLTVRTTDVNFNTYDEAFSIELGDQVTEPTSVLPGPQNVDSNTDLVFSTGNSNAVSVTDMDAGSDLPLQVFISVNDGVLTLSQTTGLSILGGSNGGAFMTIHGTESDLNAAFEGMTFTPDTNFSGSVLLNMTTSLDADMVGHYTFESGTVSGSTVNDESVGLSQNGTLGGSPAIVNDAERGDVLSLNGSGQFMQITGLMGNPADVTLSAWINADAVDTSGAVVISMGTSPALYLQSDGTLIGYYESGGTNNVLQTTESFVGTGWRHVAVSIDATNSNMTLYVDGVAVTSTTPTGAIEYDNSPDTYIGRAGDGGGAFDFDGMIDDARIYSRALSSGEIAAIAAGNTTSSDSVAITVNDSNSIPVAVTDPVTTDENTPVIIDPTANDTDADSDSIDIVEFTQPANGSVTDNGNGTLTYTPNASYNGSDSFEYVAIDAGAGLQHYWGLDGDAVDAIGSANGTLTGTSTVAGDFGNGMEFNESSDYVTLPDVNYNSEFTISFEFKVDEINGSLFQYLYSHGDINGEDSINIFMVEDSHGSNPNVLRTVVRDVNDTLDNNALEIDISNLGLDLVDSQFHTYTLTAGPNGLEVFIDGVSVASDATRGTDGIDPSGDLYLGRRSTSPADRYFGGVLDSVQIYDNAMSSDQISDLAAGVNRGSVNVTVDAVNDAPYFTNLPEAREVEIDTPNAASVVTSADLDNDGDLDIIAATDDGIIQWYENDGAGNFGSANAIDTEQNFNSVVAYDLDGDGDMDIVALNDDPADLDSGVFIYDNNFIGSGTVSFTENSFEGNGGSGEQDASNLAIGDIDSNGLADLVVSFGDSGSSSVVVYEQNTVGVWTKNVVDTFNTLYAVDIADIDGDTHLDIVVAEFNSSDELRWYKNDGNATAGFTSNVIGTRNAVYDLQTGDIDGDGDADIVTIDWSSDGIRWFENSGGATPTFTAHTVSAGVANLMYDVHLSDIDGDSDLDILVADKNSSDLLLFENTGDQDFKLRTLDSNIGGVEWVETADIDGDGNLDILAAETTGDSVRVYFNHGDGYVVATTNEDINANGFGVQIADDDAGAAVVEISINVINGSMTLTTGAVTVLSGSSGSSAITVEGTISDINTMLNSLSYSPTPDFNGLGEIQITVDDRGNTGSGGAKTATESLFIEVLAVNDAGSINTGLDYLIGDFGGSTSTTFIGKANDFADNMIAIDPSQTYDLSVIASAANIDPSEYHYLGFISYDSDGLAITGQYYGLYPGATNTTLAVDLVAGATEIVLTDATGWHNGASTNGQSLAWYGYTNSDGFTYDDYTYTRNLATSIWSAGAISGNTITLDSAWTGPTLKAGDAVGNAYAPGGTYQYSLLSAGAVPSTPTAYNATIGGGVTTDGTFSNTLFRPGTAYISPLVLANFTSTSTELTISDFTVTSNTGTTIFTEGGPAVGIIDGDVEITDVDDLYTESVTIELTNGKIGDILNVNETAINALGISVAGIPAGALTVDGTITLTLTSDAADTVTHDDYEAALAAITFENTSQDPDTTNRVLTFVQNDGDNDSATESLIVKVHAVDDAPVVSVTASSPTWTENGGSVGLFSGASIDPVESGETIASLVLSVDGLANGNDEKLLIDGQSFSLVDLVTGTTAANGYEVSVSVAGTTATVTISKAGGFSGLDAEALLNAVSYDNTSEDPSGAARVVTFQSVTDSDQDGVNDTQPTALRRWSRSTPSTTPQPRRSILVRPSPKVVRSSSPIRC